jgi:hypothetical protein
MYFFPPALQELYAPRPLFKIALDVVCLSTRMKRLQSLFSCRGLTFCPEHNEMEKNILHSNTVQNDDFGLPDATRMT